MIYIQNRFNLKVLFAEHPEFRPSIGSDGKDSRFEKNIFSKIPLFIKEKENDDDVKVLGVYNNKRQWRYIPKRFCDFNHENLMKYKVVIAATNGRGNLGEVFASPFVEKPMEAYTRSFISLGAFETENEGKSALKYVKTKFLRAMLAILKITQMNNKDVWKYVPLQDFTSNSDIDWSKSIAEIDRQLYAKYSLDETEIEFIESHVKEME